MSRDRTWTCRRPRRIWYIPKWTYKYRAWLDLLDLRETFRTPEVPLGRVDLRGEGTIENGAFLGKGSFAGDNITLGFSDFHSANLSSRSSYIAGAQTSGAAGFCGLRPGRKREGAHYDALRRISVPRGHQSAKRPPLGGDARDRSRGISRGSIALGFRDFRGHR